MELTGSDLDVVVALFFGCAAVITIFLAVASRWPGIFLALLVSLAEQHLGLVASYRLSGFEATVSDFLFGSLFVAGFVRLIHAVSFSSAQRLWLLFSALAMLAFALGASRYGVHAAGLYFRPIFYLLAGGFYALSFEWSEEDFFRGMRLWALAAGLLVGVALLRWFMPNEGFWNPSGEAVFGALLYQRERVLPAASSLLLSQVAIVGIFGWARGRAAGAERLLTVCCLAMVIFLFHRSVWVSTIVALAGVTLYARRDIGRLGGIAALLVVTLAAISLLAAGLGHDLIASPVASAVEEAVSDNSTIDWRIQGWRYLLQRALASGPVNVLFGSGYGSGYERLINNQVVIVSPHNAYLEMFLNAGVAGAATWILYHWRTFWNLLASVRQVAGDDVEAALALIVSLLIYNIPYSPGYEQGIMLGMLGGVALAARQRSTQPVLTLAPG
ncbi:O-antigen ligase family protein [Radicibacter daui]|uniref:O-antigen ligase family protein n=1 Tax=Radicibacter daui TaxID=3064829 RepID=UPI004046CAA9